VRRVLVLNAHDIGRSTGINSGVAYAHDRGIVTSASAMVRWPAAAEAAALARERPELGVGLHVDLGEWTHAEGGWHAVYECAAVDRATVATEVEAQLTLFRSLFGSPTHLDSHQHVHRAEPLRSLLAETGRTLGIPVRELTPGVDYRGDFYGQTAEGTPLPGAIGVDSLLRLLPTLGPGVTELGCHPASEPELASSYAAERTEELRVLCDPRVRAAIQAEGIELRTFAGLALGRPEP
jgi:predicted glycoside hydrolase/deacetylase ChbG (UPF0249 family)